MAHELLVAHKKAFGLLAPEDQEKFKGGLTNGSTMGNRCGIHTALAHHPDAIVYFAAESHYIVAKTLRDCDALTNRWSGGKPRYCQIPCAGNGSILVDALVWQAVSDRKRCVDEGQSDSMILFANVGTTFQGARDDLVGISRSLHKVGMGISYIHVDGALDFGFENCGIRLGPPASVGADGMPLVQGITFSRHKALGQMVSGEMLCFSPDNQMSGFSNSEIDSRLVFEAWLYSRVYRPDEMSLMLRYCLDKAARLEKGFRQLGLATKRNDESIIAVFERPCSWIVEEFSLRPEGDWVHFITMPHISSETIDFFLDRISGVDKACRAAFSCVTPLPRDIIGQPVRLMRLGCQGTLAERVSRLSAHQDLTTAVKSSLRGALLIAATDEQDEIQIVFLAKSISDQSIRVGPLLVKSCLFCFLATGWLIT